jgi:hypothetical protein
MTYFKRRRSLREHIHVMDPRVLQAAIDRPRWWQQQRELVAERETVVDFSRHGVGECDDPLAKIGIRVSRSGDKEFVARIVEQHGIRGVALNGKYELRLPKPVDQIDILIAHFGEVPTLKAYGADRQVVTIIADDRPRQAELLRLLGDGINRVTIEAPAEASLIQIAFPGHTRSGNPTGESKKQPLRSKRSGKES